MILWGLRNILLWCDCRGTGDQRKRLRHCFVLRGSARLGLAMGHTGRHRRTREVLANRAHALRHFQDCASDLAVKGLRFAPMNGNRYP